MIHLHVLLLLMTVLRILNQSPGAATDPAATAEQGLGRAPIPLDAVRAKAAAWAHSGPANAAQPASEVEDHEVGIPARPVVVAQQAVPAEADLTVHPLHHPTPARTRARRGILGYGAGPAGGAARRAARPPAQGALRSWVGGDTGVCVRVRACVHLHVAE